MRAFVVIVLLVGAFAAWIVWRIHTERGETPRAAERAAAAPSATAVPRSGGPSLPGARLLERLREMRDGRGVRHALLTSPSRQGLHYRKEGEEPVLLDGGVRVGDAADLALDANGRPVAAYVDAPTGEVRVAVPDGRPQPWIALKRLERPERIALSVGEEGTLVSYYDAEAQILYYSYHEARSGAWRHGVAGRGEGYRVATGRPGALVLSR